MYINTFTIVVLSEEPIQDAMELSTVVTECDEGAFVAHSLHKHTLPVSPQRMAKLLIEAGSDPEFFNLDAEGNKVAY